MLRGALTRQAEPRLVQVAHRLGGGGCLLLLLLLGGGRLHRRHRGHGLGGEGDLAHGPVVQPPGHGTELCQLEDAAQTRGGEGRGGRQYDWSNVLRIQDMSYLWGSLQPSTHPVVIISLFRVWRRRSTLLTRVGFPLSYLITPKLPPIPLAHPPNLLPLTISLYNHTPSFILKSSLIHMYLHPRTHLKHLIRPLSTSSAHT